MPAQIGSPGVTTPWEAERCAHRIGATPGITARKTAIARGRDEETKVPVRVMSCSSGECDERMRDYR